jgi:uncharacterized SAM-binding protein YcdF (DUF218 family)
MSASAVAAIARELILPPASLFCLLAIGMIAGRWHPRAGKALAAGSLLALLLLSTGLGAALLVSPLENLTRALPSAQGSGAQAIVVLAAGRYAHAPEYGDAEVPDYVALARLRYAARLHRQTGLPLLVSGGNGTPDGRFQPKALSMASALREDFSIPVRWIEPDSENTADNAAFSTKILKQENIKRILLVTDAMHMPRSVLAFQHSGMDVIPAPTVFFSAEPFALPQLLPSAEHLRRSYYALYEWIGLAWYSLRLSDDAPAT